MKKSILLGMIVVVVTATMPDSAQAYPWEGLGAMSAANATCS